MKKWNYYNDSDPFVCEWARNLISAKLVPDGEVDCRSIGDVSADDLKGFIQCHFFCGILGWPYALRLAGWPDDRPVWTGSCPCQPFSVAGKRQGTDDERHLWPEFRRLIAECNPTTVFGEQVASRDGRGWLAAVRADLEGLGYAVGATDLCAAGIGAPHIRQRLYWVADALPAGWAEGRPGAGNRPLAGCGGASGRGIRGPGESAGARAGAACERPAGLCQDQRPGPLHGLWRDADWLYCRDGKWRPVEPGTAALAHGVSGRVGLLRGYGNAIVAPLAAAFITAAEAARADADSGR